MPLEDKVPFPEGVAVTALAVEGAMAAVATEEITPTSQGRVFLPVNYVAGQIT
jgi:hypothetical protein